MFVLVAVDKKGNIIYALRPVYFTREGAEQTIELLKSLSPTDPHNYVVKELK